MKTFLAIYIGTEEAMANSKWNELDEDARKAREAAGVRAWTEWDAARSASIVNQGAPLGQTKRASATGTSEIMECMPLPTQ